MTDPTEPSEEAINAAPLHAEIARLREERSTLEQAFADICGALGCERDNESPLFAIAQITRERDALKERAAINSLRWS